MRQALVTGATGGLGLALAGALLAAGYAVRATGRDRRAGQRLVALGATFAPAELTDPCTDESLLRGVDAVFHTAALSSPWGPPGAFRTINLDTTSRLVTAAKAAGAEAFIFVSTPSVYAEPRDRLGLTEESPLAARFANAYAASKHAAEQAVLAANAPGFATVVIRPRALVGPDDKVLLPRLVRVARRGSFPLFRGGRALIDLTDVRDAAAALIAADRAGVSVGGRAFNVSGGLPATVADTLGEAFGALGLKTRLVHRPYAVAAAGIAGVEAVYRLLPGRPEPPVTRYSLDALAFSRTFDLTAARAALGWSPQFSPQDAIARTAAAWRSHAPL